jgi:hypothetical protein
MRCRNSGAYGRWVFAIMDTPFCPNDGVSTKAGQLHLRYKTVKNATRHNAFQIDGVRARGQRGEHQPVAVGDHRRIRTAGDPNEVILGDGDTEYR